MRRSVICASRPGGCYERERQRDSSGVGGNGAEARSGRSPRAPRKVGGVTANRLRHAAAHDRRRVRHESRNPIASIQTKSCADYSSTTPSDITPVSYVVLETDR